jgi:pimeloyl-ACP methyl ester carboxylesterase
MTMNHVLAHAVSGDGPPLLLLNGGLMSYAAWEPIAAPLAQSHRVVRFDFRGQLLSPGDAPPTIDGHADDVVRLMDALSLDAAHVAGVSFGGLVGLNLAARHPDRVRSLVAVSTTDRVTPEIAERGRPLRDATHAAAEGGDGGRVLDIVSETTWSAEYRTEQAAALAMRRQAVSLLPRAWFVGAAQLMGALEHLDLTPLLPRIQCPALIIGGDSDVTFPIEHSRALAQAIPGARMIVMARGSHGVALERPSEVVALVVDFLREAEDASMAALGKV